MSLACGKNRIAVRYAESRLVVAGVSDVATETIQGAGSACGTKATGFLADGNTILKGTWGANITAAPATVGAGGLASRAGVLLANEDRGSGWQRSLGAKEVLGIDKGEKRNSEEIESLGRHCHALIFCSSNKSL